MAKTIKFIFNGYDNNFAVEAPADSTLAQLLSKQTGCIFTDEHMDTEDSVYGIKPKEENI